MVERTWRLIATAVCFASFGIGGVFIGVCAYPVLQLISRDSVARAHRTQAFIHRNFQVFVLLMRALRVISLEVHGAENLGRGRQLILANHPSLIDVVILMSLLRQTNCIVKQALWRNPFTRGPVIGAGYINNCEGAELVKVCVEVLERGDNLIVFPEGTRTVPRRPLCLKRGAANIAVRARCTVTPVIIRANTPFLTKGEKWYQVPPVRPHIIVEVKDDIDMEQYRLGVPASRACRDFTHWLQEYFTREVAGAAA